MQQEVKDYIKLHHRQTQTWLQEHINKKFNQLVNLSTIRTLKRQMGCLTNRTSIKRDWVNFIRNNWKKYSDIQLAEILKNKFQRDISPSTVKAIRLKYHKYRPQKRGWTIKEIRICPYCGNEIKITLRNPKQKFCCPNCASKWHSENTYKKHLSNCSKEEVKEFVFEWQRFSKKVLYENKFELNKQDLEDVYSEYYGLIPSIISGIKQRKLTCKQHIKGYIAKAIRHLIFKKLRKVIDKKQNEINFDNFKNYQKYRLEFKTC